MSVEKLDKRALSAKQIQESKETITPAAADYTVVMVNKTDWVVYALRDVSGQVTNYPKPIGRHGPNDAICEDLFNQNKWDGIATSLCTGNPYSITLLVEKGGKKGEIPLDVTPTCNVPILLLCFED